MKKILFLTIILVGTQLLNAQISTTQIGGSYVEDIENYGFANNGKLMALGWTGAGTYQGSSFLKRAGSVKLYLNGKEGWKHEKTINSENPGYEFGYGAAIAMNEKQLFVTQRRSLFVYDIGDKDTNLTLIQTIEIGNSESLALNKNTLVYRKSNGKYAISKLENNVWTETQEMQVGNNLYFDACYNIKCKDEWLFFGMPEYQLDKNGENTINEAGMVVAYKLNVNDQYEFHSYIEPKVRKENSSFGYGEYFGWSVDYESDWLVVSAQQADGNSGRKQGAVYTFKLENDKWVEKQKIGSKSDFFLEQFGCGVTLIDGNLLVGNKNENPIEGGLRIYQFYRIGDNFQFKAQATAGAQKLLMVNDTFYSTYSNDEDVYLYQGTFEKETVSIKKTNKSEGFNAAYNQVSHSVIISSNQIGNLNFEIIDLSGRTIANQVETNAPNNTINLQLPKGLRNQMLIVKCGNDVKKVMITGH